MTTPVLTFFNTKGGVGKTSLVYHLAYMFAERGLRVLAVDLDPQVNLTASFLDETLLDKIWNGHGTFTMRDSVLPLLDGGDFAPVTYHLVEPRLALVPGHLGLATFENTLSTAWADALADPNPVRPFRMLSAFWRSTQDAARRFGADLVVVDVGPNLGALNRAALIATDYVVVPLGGDVFSQQDLGNLGATLHDWRAGWSLRRERWENASTPLPGGGMAPLGYVAMRHGVRLTRPVKADTRWLGQIPLEYRRNVLGETDSDTAPLVHNDPRCLAMVKNYHSLMPLSQEAGKPIFALRPADGAIGAHAAAAREAYTDFDALARQIALRINPLWAEPMN